ncbi:MAG TPA: hypothetical protein VMM60_18140, partial [Ilumatobacter sp.]|nr:hypothetical protein [Ilumatobacter sp.]
PVGRPDKPQVEWSDEAGTTGWYLYNIESAEVIEDPARIIELIRSIPSTPRVVAESQEVLIEARAAVQRHIRNTYLKAAQAPVGVEAKLKAWLSMR